ncbi:hypothetical protein Athai_25910 [Actinocatenispora thailandica]|uniref:Uncharacterized protein n=1 Tax=Actinocatenispora thailandica TaxID=227318 RepID=A0A7R7HWP1_9ACTN|nr:hypothetical protein Athai_25910 [Actinocatenispora thailandica]
MTADGGRADPEFGAELGGGQRAALQQQLGHRVAGAAVPGACVTDGVTGPTGGSWLRHTARARPEARGRAGRVFHNISVTYFGGSMQTGSPVKRDTKPSLTSNHAHDPATRPHTPSTSRRTSPPTMAR